MCGIYGMVSAKPSEGNYRAFARLSVASATRGTDATGICYFDELKKKHYIDKHHIDADEFYKRIIKRRVKELSKTHVAIGHCRAYTHGKPGENNNNHPIYSKNYIMVHNGICISTEKINGYKYMGDVDSELLLAQIQTRGFKGGLEKGGGTAAVALLISKVAKERDTIYLYRDTNPIVLAYRSGDPTIFFASSEDILKRALTDRLGFFCDYMMKDLPSGELWKIHVVSRKKQEVGIDFIEEIKYGEKHRIVGTGNNYYQTQNRFGGTAGNSSRGTTTNRGGTGKEEIALYGEKYNWTTYFNLETEANQYFEKFKWQWDTMAEVWVNDEEPFVKKYIVHRKEMCVCSPQYGLSIGWYKEMPFRFRGKKYEKPDDVKLSKKVETVPERLKREAEEKNKKDKEGKK